MLIYLSALGIGTCFPIDTGPGNALESLGPSFILLVAIGADYNMLLISRIATNHHTVCQPNRGSTGGTTSALPRRCSAWWARASTWLRPVHHRYRDRADTLVHGHGAGLDHDDWPGNWWPSELGRDHPRRRPKPIGGCGVKMPPTQGLRSWRPSRPHTKSSATPTGTQAKAANQVGSQRQACRI